MDDALLRSDPSQLRVGRQSPPERGHVRADALERDTSHHRREGPYAGDTQLSATAQRECESVASETIRSIRVENDVGGGVIRIWMHRIGAVASGRRRKADVQNFNARDRRRHCHLLLRSSRSRNERGETIAISAYEPNTSRS